MAEGRTDAGSETVIAMRTAMTPQATAGRRRQVVGRLAPLALLVLAACASVPSGPSVMALPGSNKSFDQFRSDETAATLETVLAHTGARPELLTVELTD